MTKQLSAILQVTLILCVPTGLFAQQTNYSGTSITGFLKLTATTNLTSAAKEAAVRASIDAALPAFETPTLPLTPKVMPRTLLSPHRFQQSPLLPHSAANSSLAVSNASTVPTLTTATLSVSSGPTAVGFKGLSSDLQQAANNGDQFTVEPPNPAIAIAHGYVLEGVNNAVQIYNTSGSPVLAQAVSSNQLFGLAPAVIRSTGVYGPYPTDMRVFYDPQVDRWFVLQRAQDQDAFGDALLTSHLYLAVSQTADPTGTYNVYTADTTDTGRAFCPCLLDYPQIGADKYGFYISANEFDSETQETFVDSSIFAISKADLASGAKSPRIYRFAVSDLTGYEFAVQPAFTPPGASNFLADGGVEYFASTLDYSSGDAVSIWALENTSSLDTNTPSLQLSRNVVPIGLVYTVPESATQKVGPIPYGVTQGFSLPAYIDGGDARMQSLVYSGGRLYMTFATAANDSNNLSVVGSAYLVLSPTLRSSILKASVLQQNLLVVKGNSLLRPAVAVNAQGEGSITATLVGAGYFPSAAFVPVSVFVTPTVLRLVATGLAPEDGFTGYEGVPARWGDFATAVVAADGTVWSSVEYIGHITTASPPPGANWDTYIMQTKP